MVTSQGSDPKALLDAVLNKQTMLVASDHYAQFSPQHQRASAVLMSPLLSLKTTDVQERVYTLLKQAWKKFNKKTISEETYFHFLLPNKADPRARFLTKDFYHDIFLLIAPECRVNRLSFGSLEEVKGKSATIIAADSLCSPLSLNHLTAKKQAMTNLYTEGQAPGEAAVIMQIRDDKCHYSLNSLKLTHVFIPNLHNKKALSRWLGLTQECWLKNEIPIPEAYSIDYLLGNVGVASEPLYRCLLDSFNQKHAAILQFEQDQITIIRN